MSTSYIAGQKAAKNRTNINNSYPHNHEEFVAGYKSIISDAKEDLVLKGIAKSIAPKDYK